MLINQRFKQYKKVFLMVIHLASSNTFIYKYNSYCLRVSQFNFPLIFNNYFWEICFSFSRVNLVKWFIPKIICWYGKVVVCKDGKSPK